MKRIKSYKLFIEKCFKNFIPNLYIQVLKNLKSNGVSEIQ